MIEMAARIFIIIMTNNNKNCQRLNYLLIPFFVFIKSLEQLEIINKQKKF